MHITCNHPLDLHLSSAPKFRVSFPLYFYSIAHCDVNVVKFLRPTICKSLTGSGNSQTKVLGRVRERHLEQGILVHPKQTQ